MQTLMKRALVATWFATAALFGCTPVALATTQWPTGTAGESVGSIVGYCLNSSGNATPWWNAAGIWQCAGSAIPVSGSFSATLSGFHAESSLTPITATTGGVSSSSFTAGKTILVSNTGSTNTAYCSPGASATTASTPILPGQSVAITTVAETTITCITSTSTTAVSFQVGTGLATGWGGSGAGGGGGAVTIADGADVAQGTTSDAAYSGSGSGTIIALLKWIGASINGAIAAGTNLIGGTTTYFGSTASVNQPCQTGTKITNPVSQAASGVIITHSGSLKTYICGGSFNLSDAESVSITEGTGTTCGTGAAALMGSTTVANGMALSANEGMSLGSGHAANIVSKTGGDDICLLQSATGRAAGWVTYVQQ